MWLQMLALGVLLDTARRLTRCRSRMYHPQAANAWLVFTCMLMASGVIDLVVILNDPSAINTIASALHVAISTSLWTAVTLTVPGAIRTTLAHTRGSEALGGASQQ